LDNFDSKANINAAREEHSGLTALKAAAGGGHFGITKFLINNKVRVTALEAVEVSRYIAELVNLRDRNTAWRL
jgi:hypothetical protein